MTNALKTASVFFRCASSSFVSEGSNAPGFGASPAMVTVPSAFSAVTRFFAAAAASTIFASRCALATVSLRSFQPTLANTSSAMIGKANGAVNLLRILRLLSTVNQSPHGLGTAQLPNDRNAPCGHSFGRGCRTLSRLARRPGNGAKRTRGRPVPPITGV